MSDLLLVMPYQMLPPRSQRLRNWARSRGFNVRGVYWERRAIQSGFRDGDGEVWSEIHRGGGEKSWRLAAHYPRFARRVYEAVLRDRPAAVLAFDLDAAIGCAMARRVYDFRLIYDVADTFYLRHDFPRPVRRVIESIERVVLRAADIVMVPDQSRITAVEEEFRGKIEIIYNCPSRDALASAPAGAASHARSPATFLLSGHLAESRGCRSVLDAASLVPDARIVVAGHVPEPGLLAEFESHPQVTFHGRVTHAESVEQFASSQAAFTLYEPSVEINRRAASNKWYDAMLASTPVIVNREVISSRWLEERGMGYVVPYGDVNALANTMHRIIANPREAETKGAAGRRLFETEFNWERMEERLDAAFLRARIPLPTTDASEAGSTRLPAARL